MSLERLLLDVPTFVLVFFRTAAMMLAAPLFGSARVPRIVKVLMALVLSMGMMNGLRPIPMPPTAWALAIAIGGEIIFGLVIGTALSLTFVAVEWSGQVIGQQIGFNIAETVDPQFGGTSVIGDLYFMFALVVFLLLRGHHILIRGLRDSFITLPLLSVGMNRSLFDLLINLLQAAMLMAFRMAAALLVTVLIVDLLLGFLGKTMPQFNLMSTGISLRSLVGMLVLIIGLSLTNQTIRSGLLDSLATAQNAWHGVNASP